jgi:short-subunit dehydrogenase
MANTKKVAIITGISSGMGRAAAIMFNERGYVVYGGARRVERMTDLAEKGIHTVALDVTDESSNKALVEKVLAEQGRIDVLINNAGYGEYGALEEVTIEKAKKQFDVNVFGLANITQLVIPTMRKQKSGRIINNSSIGGRIYMPMGGWYHASKHALEVYSDVLRMELKQFNIQVSVIEPGGTATEWGQIANQTGHESTHTGSPYEAWADVMGGDAVENSNFPLATPEKIAELMWKAATDKKPKLRYLPGTFEKLSAFMARKLPVRTFDWIVMKMFNSMAK